MNQEFVKNIINEVVEEMGLELVEVNKDSFVVRDSEDREYTVLYENEMFSFEYFNLNEVKEEIRSLTKEAIGFKSYKEEIENYKRQLRDMAAKFSQAVEGVADELRDENDDVVLSFNLSNAKRAVKDTANSIYKEKTLESFVSDIAKVGAKAYESIGKAVKEGEKAFNEVIDKYNEKCDCECGKCDTDKYYDGTFLDLQDEVENIDSLVYEVLLDMGVDNIEYSVELSNNDTVKVAEVKFHSIADLPAEYTQELLSVGVVIPATEEDKPYLARAIYNRLSSLDKNDIFQKVMNDENMIFDDKVNTLKEFQIFIDNLELPEYAE